MLSNEGVSNRGYNSSRCINQWGAYDNKSPEKLYPWNDGVMTETVPTQNPDVEWSKEYKKLQNYYLRFQVTASQ